MIREKSKWKTHKEESTEARHRGGATRSSEETGEKLVERRGCVNQQGTEVNRKREEPMDQAKPFSISKQVVWEAYKEVKANQGAAGVDSESIEEFEKDLKNNLYKIWNRMSSGTYIPPPVLTVAIPKKDGGQRRLGIPTVGDRVAQTVVKKYLEPEVEPHFHPDSYGYRPGKSALAAVGVTRERCWRYNWVIDLDIRGFFDNLDHALVMRAVGKYTQSRWILLYVERWLKAPIKLEDGTLVEREKGTPQGGVASPLLANIFLHLAFDEWMRRKHPEAPFERYADDIVVHCKSEEQAQQLLRAIEKRLAQCKLDLHPEKTKIVYCKDDDRRGRYGNEKFDFLGYTFRARRSKNRWGRYFINFSPAVSNKAAKKMRQEMRRWRLNLRSDKSIDDLARMWNPVIRGWIQYYGRYYRSALNPVFRHLNVYLVRWAGRKYKRLSRHRQRAE
jgi:group II intron reverse transcriptase/maturase